MKSRRQIKIQQIIEEKDIATQEELAAELEKAGYEVTQATVSRDIKELGLVKIPTGTNTYKYGFSSDGGWSHNEDRLRRRLREMVHSVDYSENIIVIKTYPGNAQTVAFLIDGAKWPEIIGSVAGDDTILLVVKAHPDGNTQEQVKAMMDKLNNLIE